MNTFQSQRLDLQKREIKLIQDSQDFNKRRLKIQDGYAMANSMLEKHSHRMSESDCDYWFQVANKYAKEMAAFDEQPPVLEDYDTPIVRSNDRPAIAVQDPTPSAQSQQKKRSKTVQPTNERNYSILSDSHPSGKPASGRPPHQESVIMERNRLQNTPTIPITTLDPTLNASETLEFILGPQGEPIPIMGSQGEFIPVVGYQEEAILETEPVYTSSIPLYQSITVPTASSHPFNKDPAKKVGMRSSAPTEVQKGVSYHGNNIIVRNGIAHSITGPPEDNACTSTRSNSSSSSSSKDATKRKTKKRLIESV